MHTTKGYQKVNNCYLWVLDYGVILNFSFLFFTSKFFFSEDLLLYIREKQKMLFLKKKSALGTFIHSPPKSLLGVHTILHDKFRSSRGL